MWKIIFPNETIKYLFQGNNFSIGRSVQCDYQISNLTVSRKHALLECRKEGCILRNFSSSSLMCNNQSVGATAELTKKKENILLLGACKSAIKVVYSSLVICTSFLTKKEQIHTTQLCNDLGLSLTRNVHECTHLVMTQIGVTTKCLIALIEGKKIVSLSWLRDLNLSQINYDYLSEQNYLPVVINKQLNFTWGTKQIQGFLQPKTRSKLFRNYLFLYVSKTMHQNSSTFLQLAGAETVLFGCSTEENSDDKACQLVRYFYQQKKQFSLQKQLYIVGEESDCSLQLKKEINKWGTQIRNEVDLGMSIISNSTTPFVDPKEITFNETVKEIQLKQSFDSFEDKLQNTSCGLEGDQKIKPQPNTKLLGEESQILFNNQDLINTRQIEFRFDNQNKRKRNYFEVDQPNSKTAKCPFENDKNSLQIDEQASIQQTEPRSLTNNQIKNKKKQFLKKKTKLEFKTSYKNIGVIVKKKQKNAYIEPFSVNKKTRSPKGFHKNKKLEKKKMAKKEKFLDDPLFVRNMDNIHKRKTFQKNY
ncbi:nibrin-related [Anaeramoeba flamelloides]|uniref:Nibrin-related n=1 Tax=Anaeramoeba flamelloides TaxID=1746091 RepID=A0AAV7Z3P7_9EUKA|nr:nibrin-related [Anaeramoeba flamelloides]